MQCCDEMDFEREGRREYDVEATGRVVYLVVTEHGACLACGATMARVARLDLDCLAGDVPEDSFEAEDIDRTCGTCGGSGGIPEAPCHACGGRG